MRTGRWPQARVSYPSVLQDITNAPTQHSSALGQLPGVTRPYYSARPCDIQARADNLSVAATGTQPAARTPTLEADSTSGDEQRESGLRETTTDPAPSAPGKQSRPARIRGCPVAAQPNSPRSSLGAHGNSLLLFGLRGSTTKRGSNVHIVPRHARAVRSTATRFHACPRTRLGPDTPERSGGTPRGYRPRKAPGAVGGEGGLHCLGADLRDAQPVLEPNP